MSEYILFVEDNSDDVDLTLVSFQEFHFTWPVVVVRDGAEALDYLFGEGKYADRDQKTAPTLILLDLNLPKVHGLEVLRRVRADQSLRNVLVVILTSSGEERDQIEAKKLGADLYIRKPVNFDHFEQVVQQIDDLLCAVKTRQPAAQ